MLILGLIVSWYIPVFAFAHSKRDQEIYWGWTVFSTELGRVALLWKH